MLSSVEELREAGLRTDGGISAKGRNKGIFGRLSKELDYKNWTRWIATHSSLRARRFRR